MASSIFDSCLHERMPEMQIILYEVIDKCSDIFLAAHIFPVPIERLFFQYETPTIFLGPLMLFLLLGLFIIGGGATMLSIVITLPLISITLLFIKGILPKVCFSPYIRQT